LVVIAFLGKLGGIVVGVVLRALILHWLREISLSLLFLLLLALLLGLLYGSSIALFVSTYQFSQLGVDLSEAIDAIGQVLVLDPVTIGHGQDPPDVVQVLLEGSLLSVLLHLLSWEGRSPFLSCSSESPLEVSEHGVQVSQVPLEEGLSSHLEVVVNCLPEFLHFLGLVRLYTILLGFDVFPALVGVDLVEPLLHLA